MRSLQPYHIFRDEATRINALYWTSKYSFTRTAALLKLISDTSSSSVDPRVNQLWGALEVGQASITTRKLSDFVQILDNNAEDLRAISILKICSAFENALCGFFYLCSLYQPLSEFGGQIRKVPEVLTSDSEFENAKSFLKEKSELCLHGKYTKRLNYLCDKWALPRISGPKVLRLNGYYKKRHLIAHDQSLLGADSPEWSSGEITNNRISIDEGTWKNLLDDFNSVLFQLNSEISKNVVRDNGLYLAVYRLVKRDGVQALSEIQKKLADEWRMGNPKAAKTRDAIAALGFKIKQVGGNKYRVSAN